VFSKEENKDELKDLLESILGIKIENVEIKNPEIPRELKDSKAGILDIKAYINDDTVIDIEMQVADEYNIADRSTFYLVSTSSNELKIGENYIDLKKTIVINLLNFNCIERNAYMHIAHMKFEETTNEAYIDMGYKNEQEIATKDLEMIFIELPKFIQKNPDAESNLNKWLWLIAGKEEKVKMAKTKSKTIEKAISIMDEMSMDPKEWEVYESRRRAIVVYNSNMIAARRDGLEKGERLRICKR
jgi:predicted transposase/invertase (TIGR01784 family)